MPKPRYSPETQREEDCLTLKESFRDKAGRVHTRTLLTGGIKGTGTLIHVPFFEELVWAKGDGM